jgi:hypothetical protein
MTGLHRKSDTGIALQKDQQLLGARQKLAWRVPDRTDHSRASALSGFRKDPVVPRRPTGVGQARVSGPVSSRPLLPLLCSGAKFVSPF